MECLTLVPYWPCTITPFSSCALLSSSSSAACLPVFTYASWSTRVLVRQVGQLICFVPCHHIDSPQSQAIKVHMSKLPVLQFSTRTLFFLPI